MNNSKSKVTLLALVTTVLFSFLLLVATGCSSPSPTPPPQPGTSTEAKPAAPAPPPQPWYDQKPTKIVITTEAGEQAALTRNFYFIMDGSGSMNEGTDSGCGGDQQFPDKISGARWAVKKFLENVPDDVNIGLYVFDYEGKREVVPLGNGNRAQFIQAIDEIKAGGGTPLAQAIHFGTDQLITQYKKQLGYGEFRLVVVTDGKASSIPQAALYAARYGIPIYTIGLCVGMDHPLRNYSVSYRAADNFADLSQGLQETLAEIPDFDVTQFESQEKESPGTTETPEKTEQPK